jgi:hypothetical protein
MKQFYSEDKTNFVDVNNVFAGFDNYSCCCESFGDFFSTEPGNDKSEITLTPEEMELAVFDPSYHEEMGPETSESGGVAVFKVLIGERTVYLNFFNYHNGYYGHGFEMKVGDLGVYEGSL